MTNSLWIHRIAAFTDRQAGGNPAGVAIVAALPSETAMQRIAYEVALSETVFAAPQRGAWRVRYFSPETEIPFCGHATIALGAALTAVHGNDAFRLVLNDAEITVSARVQGGIVEAALDSPPTRSIAADGVLVQSVLSLFDYSQSDLVSAPAARMGSCGARITWSFP